MSQLGSASHQAPPLDKPLPKSPRWLRVTHRPPPPAVAVSGLLASNGGADHESAAFKARKEKQTEGSGGLMSEVTSWPLLYSRLVHSTLDALNAPSVHLEMTEELVVA